MLKPLPKRIVVALFCGLVAGLTAVTIGEASSPHQEGPVRTDCQECHESVVTHWENSAHGMAAVVPAFQEAWEENGKSPECLSCHTTNYDPATGMWETNGIFCSVCHTDQSGPHPETPMPTDPSSRLCGSCHLDTYDEWQVSVHGEGEMACVNCHNPHTTTLKVGNMRDLCTTCHNEEGHFYSYTAHAQRGLKCTDCHLRVSETPIGEGHGQRLHTFRVDLATCNQCHGEEMHYPVAEDLMADTELMQSAYAPSSAVISEMDPQIVADEPSPQPAQPINYLLVAAVGAGFGAAMMPVAEGWLRRKGSKE